MMKKTGFFKFSFVSLMAVMGMYSNGAIAAEAGIASKSYVDTQVAEKIAAAVQPMGTMQTDVNALKTVVGDTNALGTDKTIIGEINTIKSSVAGSDTKVGNLENLNTTVKTDAVNAINEVNTKVGDMGQLAEVVEADTVVGAVKEVREGLINLYEDVSEYMADQGDLTQLDTTNKDSLVGAINENRGKIGNMDNLPGVKTDLVSAINEVKNGMPVFTSSGNGNVVTSIGANGTYNMGNVKIPVGGADGTTYAEIWVE